MQNYLLVTMCALAIPTQIFAAQYQGGFPARCSIHSACDSEGRCVRAHLPVSAMVIFQNDDGSLAVASSDQKNARKLGYFNTLDDVRTHFSSGTNGGFGSFIVPNREIADAVGYDVHRTSSIEQGFTDEKVKIACSRIRSKADGLN